MQERIKSVVVLAAPLVAIGAFVFARGYIKTGWWLIGGAAAICALFIFSFILPPSFRILLWISAPLRSLAEYLWRLLAQAFRPVSQRLQNYLKRGVAMYDFVAESPRAYMHSQQADFKLIPRPKGLRFRALDFVIRPDYQFGYWRAGFRIMRRGDTLLQGDIGDTVLFHMYMNQAIDQPAGIMYIRRQLGSQVAIPFYGNLHWPSFRISTNIWPSSTPSKMRLAVAIEGANSVMETEFDATEVDSIALVAWADGKPFRVFFDDVKPYWYAEQKGS